MPDFEVRDNRGRNAPSPDLGDSLLTRMGINVRRVKEQTGNTGLPFGAPRTDAAVQHMRDQKLAPTRMRRQGALGTGAGMQMATSRPRDPMWYWKQNNIPFNFTEPAELQRIREFCNTPDAPVLMADGTLKPLGTIVPGEMVMGWTYRMQWNGGLKRIWGPSRVLATNTRVADNVVQFEMASGATVKCTADHKWYNPEHTKQIWVDRGQPLPQQRMMTEYRAVGVGDELLQVQGVRTFTAQTGYGDSYSTGGVDKVIAITPIGGAQVVSMQTTTGNYVAWGYASKNCRLLYVTHPIVSACIDVYSKLPMQGMTFKCKDPQLVDFYSDLFFDQLKYEEFLLDLGTEYWLSGESWALGGWNENLGIWEADQLINPDDVEVEKSLFLNEPRFLMRLPESLRKVLTTRTPHWQYAPLVQEFPELLNYASQDALMPVSNIILKQMRFKADRYSNRGIPILMRGFRTLIQEEMLNSALDSIADRLYTPLILTKLGATASDLGTNVPWIPNQDEMEEFNAALDAALAADFRALTYHWAIDMQPVFGRENVPDLSNDFDRIVERILMVFGLSQTMLTGASAGETYAADALNRDVVTQLLSHYQKMIAQFVYDRAAIVAEAQEHFDYEVRQGKRYLITEEIYEIDEETGEERIVEQPKLLVPKLQFKTLNISDEETERQFIEALAESGVPVPYRARLQTTGIDFDEAMEQRSEEAVALAVAEQETRKKIYQALQREGLPIADDLKNDFSPKAIQAGAQPPMGASDMPVASLGQDPVDIPALQPTEDDLMQAEQMGENPNAPADVMDQDDDMVNDDDEMTEDGDPSNRPEESDEEREDMPKKNAARVDPGFFVKEGGERVSKFGMREVTAKHHVPVDNSLEDQERPETWRPHGRFGDPKHVGMRKHLDINGVPTAKPQSKHSS